MFQRLKIILLALATTLVVTTVAAEPGHSRGVGKPRMFGKGNPFNVSDLPPGRSRARLQSLRGLPRSRALKWLHRFDFPEKDLDSVVIDDEGAVLYVDPAPTGLPTEAEPALPADGIFAQQAAAAVDQAFLLHSRLGAPHVVYLDFDGHTITGTAWNNTTDPLYAKPYDLDGSPTTFSTTERSAIAEIWHRMAEDYAAFDVDVTTEEPANFGPHTGRVLITSKIDVNGRAMPYNSGGGVAYVDVWGLRNYASYYSPALVYYDNLSRGTTYIAEASAHEFGHNLSLSHDGTISVAYYAGHGDDYTSWAPIMGNSYSKNVTQWSNGEYPGANNTQDDIAIIGSRLYLIGDDHGDALNTATPLAADSSGQILVSNPETDPHNLYSENKGVIDSALDQDLFYFNTAAGQVDLIVNPAWDAFYRVGKRGANLDIQVHLMDAGGATLATSNPDFDTYARISANVPGGVYYLAVSGVGSINYSDYASTGQYFISGTIPVGSPGEPPIASFGFACVGLNCSFADSSSDSDGTITSWVWDFGDGAISASQSPSHTYASTGAYNVTLTVTDNDGLAASVSKSVNVSAPNSPPLADFGFSCTGLTCVFSDNSSDSDGTIASWSWTFGDGAGAVIQNPTHTYASTGTYTVTSTVTDNEGATAVTQNTLTVSQVSNVVLSVGVMDTGAYGNGYGSDQHETELVASFEGTGTDLTLSATGYDIDLDSEVAVYLNGGLLGYLAKGPNNGLNAGNSFSVPASQQLLGENTIRFAEQRAGWIWGVTDLLLSESTSPPPDSNADVVLSVGVMDAGAYGNGYGSGQHRTELVVSFQGTGTNLTLSATGYDIDLSDEVAVYLNGSLLGYLAKGPNNGLNAGNNFSVPASQQLSGENTIRFVEKRAGWIWGVTELLLAP